MILPSLPPEAARLCEELLAPPLLVRHLILVHAVAIELLEALAASFPGLVLDRDAVLFGAASHDLGKVLHPDELTGPGNKHEDDGPGLLIKHGVPPRLARFSRTHGRWRETDDLEDLIVALADNVWCGRRVEELETKVAAILAAVAGVETWKAWSKLDADCEQIASRSDERLAWQNAVRQKSLAELFESLLGVWVSLLCCFSEPLHAFGGVRDWGIGSQ